MARRRAGRMLTILIAVLTAVVSFAVFLFQYSQANAQCSAVPRLNPCSGLASSTMAMDSAFITLFGLFAAVVMAVGAGVEWRGLQVPDPAMTRRLEAEEREFERQQALLAYNQRMTELRVARNAAGVPAGRMDGSRVAAAPAKREQQAVPDEGNELAASRAAVAEPVIEYVLEEEKRPPTVDEARRQALENRLRTTAQRNPEALAAVLTNWIEQGQRSRQ